MEGGIRTRSLLWIASVWTSLVAIILIWQTVEYRGFVSWLAEWQFRVLDRFFPVATIAIVTAILSLPFAIIVFLRARKSVAADDANSDQRVARRASLMSHSLRFATIASGLMTCGLFLLGLAQGGIAEKPARISLPDLQSSNAREPLPDGAVELRGEVLVNRLGFYDDGFLFMSRELWVAPIASRSGQQEITTFVQVRRNIQGEPQVFEINGYLKKNSVPGGLAQLYRNSGYLVAQRPHLIYADLKSVRWPYWSAAADFAILMLLLSITALLHRRYAKRDFS